MAEITRKKIFLLNLNVDAYLQHVDKVSANPTPIFVHLLGTGI